MSSNHPSPQEDTGGNINFIPFITANYPYITDKSLISVYWNDIITKPNFSNVSFTANYNDLNNKPSFAAVATSSSYNDLNNKPFILSGFTGIGTAIPSYKLDVTGDINFNGSLYQNSSPYQNSQWINDNSNIYYNNNIGIGKTTDINEIIDINGNLKIAGIIYPFSSSIYDLGTSNYKWKDLYLSSNSIYLDNLVISKNNNRE